MKRAGWKSAYFQCQGNEPDKTNPTSREMDDVIDQCVYYIWFLNFSPVPAPAPPSAEAAAAAAAAPAERAGQAGAKTAPPAFAAPARQKLRAGTPQQPEAAAWEIGVRDAGLVGCEGRG